MAQSEKQLTLKHKYPFYIAGAFLLLMGIIPYVIALVYALPAADDFCYALEIANAGGHNPIGIFRMIKVYYLSRQGVYFSVALEEGIDPIRRMGFLGINIVLILTMMLSVIIIGALIYRFCRLHFTTRECGFLFVIAVLWGCFNTRILSELICWYGGVCNYTIPLVTGVLGIICLVKAVKNVDHKGKARNYCLLSMILGFLSCGGSLQVTGYICWIYLLFLGWSILEKKCWKITLTTFGMTLFGALINVAAPGNYARQSRSYGEISLIKAVYYTFIAIINEIKYIFSQTYIPWLLLLLIIIAFFFLKPVKNKLYHPVFVGGAVFMSWLISTFPVCYGYADSTLALRGYETLDIYIIIGLFLFINSLVNWMKLKEMFLSKEIVLAMSILVIINIGYLQSSVPVSSIPGMQCWQQIFSGELKRYHDEWIEVFNTIERSEDDIVEVPVSRWAYEANLVIMRPGMSENFENWVNNGIATYYGKEKVRVIVEDEIENDK